MEIYKMNNLITLCLVNVSKNIKRKLTNEELHNTIDLLQNFNLNPNNVHQLSALLTKKIEAKESLTNKKIEAKESLTNKTNDIIIVDMFNSVELSSMQKIFSPYAQYGKDYVVLDTVNCSEILSGGTRFRWRYSSTQNIQTGTVNSTGPIKNVVSMKLYQPNFPPLPVEDAYNSIALVSMLVEEFSAQAFIASGSRKYHYLMRLAANTAFVPASSVEAQIEDYGDGVFNFKTPITSFDTLTVSFATPIDPLVFPSDDNRIMFVLEFTYLK